MEAGRLRHRIAIERAVETQDSSGDPVIAWQPIGTVWGAIEPLRGREGVYAGNDTLMEMDTRITVRYSPLTAALTGLNRLTHQGNYFNVVSVAQIRLAQREVEILAKSGVNSG